MTIQKFLKCDDCNENFWWKMEYKTSPMPQECPLCHGTGVAPPRKKSRKIPEAPALMNGQNRVPDKLYRMQEDMSVDRAIMAAELTGGDVSDFSALKITNQKDNMREGDTANIVSLTKVQREMANNAKLVSQAPTTAVPGSQYAEAVKSGPFPNAGASMARRIGMNHHNAIGGVRAAGNLDTKGGGK